MSAALQPRQPTATDADAFLLRIDAQLPAIRERATEVEQQGMISHEVIGWLTEADVFRAMQPRQWGGLELNAATFFEGAARIASACASTGWVASVVGIHPWHIAMFDHAERCMVHQSERDGFDLVRAHGTGATGARRFPVVRQMELLERRGSL
jgi:alkylation response protein AidB-like acyl-CoA dehydrogenase